MNEIVTVDRLKSEQEAFVDAIVSAKGANLPATIESLIPVLAFSSAKAKAYQALCDASKKVAEQEELNEAALASGQRWGIVHLYGQKRLGELLPSKEETVAKRNESAIVARGNDRQMRGSQRVLPEGVDGKSAHTARSIAAHPEVLERVIAESEERKEIPTKTAVLREIRRDQDKATRAVMGERKEKSRATAGIAVQDYINTLMRVLNLLPAEPPKDGWNEETMEDARRMAHVIASRLRRFADE